MKGKFFLKEPSSKTETKIIFTYYLVQQKVNFTYTTDEVILPKEWDKVSGYPIRVRSSAKNFNRLEIIRENLLKFPLYMEELMKNGVQSDRKILRKEFDFKFKYQAEIDTNSVHDVFKEFCKYRLVMPSKDLTIKATTQKRYRSFGNLLMDFSPNLRFDHFNEGFRDSYKEYCLTRMSKESFNRQLVNLRSFLNYCYDKGYLKSTAYREYKKIALVNESKDKVILTKDQLIHLWEFDLSNDQALSDARDLFIVGAFSGLRISDFTRITKQNVRDNGQMIRINHIKTGKLSSIPMNPILEAVLEKHNYNLPKMYDQKINQLIKIACKRAGFIEEQTFIRDGEVATAKLYERITSHCAKRSYITMLHNAGASIVTISKITGTSQKTLAEEYVTITDDEIKKVRI